MREAGSGNEKGKTQAGGSRECGVAGRKSPLNLAGTRVPICFLVISCFVGHFFTKNIVFSFFIGPE